MFLGIRKNFDYPPKPKVGASKRHERHGIKDVEKVFAEMHLGLPCNFARYPKVIDTLIKL